MEWDTVRRTIQAVSGRWDIIVLSCLADGISRPAELHIAINKRSGGLSRKVMYECLQRFQDKGLVSRVEAPGGLKKTYYDLTDKGHETLAAVSKLGMKNPWGSLVDHDPPPLPPSVNTRVANPARIWDYLTGGKDNFAADREAATAVLAAMPSLAESARLTREFQADAVALLIRRGVRQFLDIGTGMPGSKSVHEIAQRLAPDSRVVYVDNDPVVLAHARALLASYGEGACSYVEADLREPGKILAQASLTLDLSRPVAVFLIAVLHFIADDENPWEITARLLRGMRGDAYLVVAHGSADIEHEAATSAGRQYNERSSASLWLRTRAEVAQFFAGTELLGPGVVPIARWWPQPPGGDIPSDEIAGHVGIGWRPARS